MTCKSCIHFDDCLVKGQTRYYGKIVACDDVEERCKFFKTKEDVAEVRHGEWEFVQIDDCIICSECKNSWNVIDNCTETFNYCPNCGAKMDGERKRFNAGFAADYLLANGVIVPPCKVGDTVYFVLKDKMVEESIR